MRRAREIALKFAIYKTLRWILPDAAQKKLGGASATRVLRDWFFRPGGAPQVIEGQVDWEDLQFRFVAPYQVLHRAQSKGVENTICRLARTVLKAGDIAIDVGANYGFVTLVMGTSVQPAGRVLSLEIDPGICTVLQGTLEKNGLSECVTPIPQGAGADDAGELVSIDALVSEHQLPSVRFIKVDVDGGDFEVLIGARETLKRHHPVVVIEMTEREREIFDFLDDCGYTCFADQANQKVKPDVWPPNLIASVEPVFIPPARSVGVEAV